MNRNGGWVTFVFLTGFLLFTSCGEESDPATDALTTSTVEPNTSQQDPGPPPLITATGFVTNDQGAPMSGAILDLIALEGQPNAAIESIRRTTEDGRFELAIAPGRWTLTVAADGYEVAEVDLEVPDEGILERDVVLRRA